jgi:dipeptidyl aminopeptidase/acylaminoacyl peptidase
MEGLGQAVELHVFPAYGHGYRAEEYMTLTLEFFGKHRRTKG